MDENLHSKIYSIIRSAYDVIDDRSHTQDDITSIISKYYNDDRLLINDIAAERHPNYFYQNGANYFVFNFDSSLLRMHGIQAGSYDRVVLTFKTSSRDIKSDIIYFNAKIFRDRE